ncbi:hypothetical protein AB8Z38_07410 [Bradyrhizobium sp. LLZ17]|uniref:Uncharacterized protein n=1 Tax=Bradyrhizobium sp. LLZ17 TaxID=3239388 RepID=A0AB39XMM8_9BRAD
MNLPAAYLRPGLVFQSRFPLYLGAFFFFTDGEFIEWVLRKAGIRFEPDAIGPDLVKCFASRFGWGALLASWKASAPRESVHLAKVPLRLTTASGVYQKFTPAHECRYHLLRI